MQLLAILGDAITPVDAAGKSIVAYLLSYGVLGIAALALAWLAFKGWRLVSPARESEIRTDARADLLSALDRVIAEKVKAEDQRDAALKIAQEQLVPLLTSFVATSQSLIPLLQELVRRKER